MATATKKKAKVSLQPLGDKVVVSRDESLDTTAGGIFLPDSAKDKPSRGTIVAIGTGKLLDDWYPWRVASEEGGSHPLHQLRP